MLIKTFVSNKCCILNNNDVLLTVFKILQFTVISNVGLGFFGLLLLLLLLFVFCSYCHQPDCPYNIFNQTKNNNTFQNVHFPISLPNACSVLLFHLLNKKN